MLREFFGFELRSYRRKPILYLFILISFMLMFLAVTQEDFTVGFGQDGLYINSPFNMAMSVMTVCLVLGLFMATAFGHGAALRDISSNFHTIVFSYPLNKRAYFWGRFLAAWVLTMIPLIGAMLGLGVGALMPFAPAEDIGPTHLLGYLQTFVLFVLPNSFILTAIIFSLSLRFRSATAGFVGTTILLVLYLVTASMVFSMETGDWVAVLDPLGLNATTHLARYWTLFELNTRYLWDEPLMIINRVGWTVGALALAWWQYRKFSFSNLSHAKPGKKRTREAKPEPAPQLHRAMPIRAFQASLRTRWVQFASMVRMDLRGVLRSPRFWILLVLAVGNGLNALAQADSWYNNGSYPVTYIMIDGLRSAMYLFTIVLAIFYAGAVVWRERDVQIDALTDAMPFTNLGRISSKIITLLLLVFLIQVLGVLMGMFTQ
ncbi:MAG: ABC transporter permease, partial [Bacteroidota bacterium]